MGTKRTSRSRAWVARQEKDPYVRKARASAYRSRAVYKLEQLHQKDRLFRRGMVVVDLGAAPGSWSQYAAVKVGSEGVIIAVDRLSFQPIAGVIQIQGDFMHAPVLEVLDKVLDGREPDLVISDLAPNLTGVHSVDQAATEDLVVAAGRFAASRLGPKGAFVAKFFEGSQAASVRSEIGDLFQKSQVRKPSASRASSAEVYLVARNPVGGGISVTDR